MRKMPTPSNGNPWPLGATWDGRGVNFALYSSSAETVTLCLFDSTGENEIERLPLTARTDNVWHGYLEGVGPGLIYGYRLRGPHSRDRRLRFNQNKLLLDPYARELSGTYGWSPAHLGLRNGRMDRRDNAAWMWKGRVGTDRFDWGHDRPPNIPLSDTVLYEAHVKGFSARHPGIPKALRGTFAGLAAPAAIEHFKSLGVTAIELMPVYAFVDEPMLVERGLQNYWGYNPISFFAPHPHYGTPHAFKEMVKALHKAGLEVILDVVYNHTAELDRAGPVYNLRGLDNPAYYRLSPEPPGEYVNDSGCGNTLNLAHPATLRLVMDSLRYWVAEMHVDGFRFDLASILGRDSGGFDPNGSFMKAVAQDPVLRRVKLIAEPWDIGADGYQLGNFPAGWSEWNDQFRNGIRDFWLHRASNTGDVARWLTASSHVFQHGGRGPQATVNYVASHDGFTIADAVSYDRKHNEANLQGNRDGNDNNRSSNGGVEGPTDDVEILANRRRLARTLLSTVFVSQGVPMLLSGDEMGRTQSGNNNAYCQDNEISWLDWDSTDQGQLEFTRQLIGLRRRIPQLRRTHWFPEDGTDVQWFRPDGGPMTLDDWHEVGGSAFGYKLTATHAEETDVLILLNAKTTPERFSLPEGTWQLLLDTARENAGNEQSVVDGSFEVQGGSLVMLTEPGPTA